MSEPIRSFNFRAGELERFLQMRNKFVDLFEKYDRRNTILPRSKILGGIFDMVFYIGLGNLRNYMPSVKEIYLDVGESRNIILRHLKLLTELNIVESCIDETDLRVRRVCLSEEFREDFRRFVDEWVVLRD